MFYCEDCKKFTDRRKIFCISCGNSMSYDDRTEAQYIADGYTPFPGYSGNNKNESSNYHSDNSSDDNIARLRKQFECYNTSNESNSVKNQSALDRSSGQTDSTVRNNNNTVSGQSFDISHAESTAVNNNDESFFSTFTAGTSDDRRNTDFDATSSDDPYSETLSYQEQEHYQDFEDNADGYGQNTRGTNTPTHGFRQRERGIFERFRYIPWRFIFRIVCIVLIVLAIVSGALFVWSNRAKIVSGLIVIAVVILGIVLLLRSIKRFFRS